MRHVSLKFPSIGDQLVPRKISRKRQLSCSMQRKKKIMTHSKKDSVEKQQRKNGGEKKTFGQTNVSSRLQLGDAYWNIKSDRSTPRLKKEKKKEVAGLQMGTKKRGPATGPGYYKENTCIHKHQQSGDIWCETSEIIAILRIGQERSAASSCHLLRPDRGIDLKLSRQISEPSSLHSDAHQLTTKYFFLPYPHLIVDKSVRLHLIAQPDEVITHFFHYIDRQHARIWLLLASLQESLSQVLLFLKQGKPAEVEVFPDFQLFLVDVLFVSQEAWETQRHEEPISTNYIISTITKRFWVAEEMGVKTSTKG